jgi:Tfp pilus assembly protein PilN
MIKINLLQTSSSAASPRIDLGGSGSNSGAEFSQAEMISSEESSFVRKEAIKNLFIILLGSLGLFSYEQVRIPELQEELRQVNQELQEVTEKNNRARAAVEQTKKLKKEQEILHSHIASIESLKKDRSQIVKILELMQKNVPANVWFNELDFSMGRVTLVGHGIADNDITNLLDTLSRSVYFKEVSLVRSSEVKTKQLGSIKKVEISGVLETGL